MSKTDKTRPVWVKAPEHLLEVHNHENGVCDIAGQPVSRATLWWRGGGRCYYDVAWWHHTFRCGCELCGIPKSERRKRRHESRRLERNWWKLDGRP